MKEMKEQLQQALEKMQQEQQAESEENLKQILDNLLKLSFEQEDLINQLKNTKTSDPKYAQIARTQKKLLDQSKVIEDSILALSKRNPQISASVNKEILNIQKNINQSIQQLAEHNSALASVSMQKSLTSINNLALMLNESLESLQQQMKNPSNKPGSGSCKKPGSGQGQKPSSQPSKPKLSELQKQLNEQLKKLKEGQQKGQQNQGKIPGSMAEQLAKMAAQQEMLRQKLQELLNKLKQQGKNPGGDIASLMEQTEKDIVNNKITEQTLMRQQEILTRLLESEKAIREQEEDQKRESKEPKNYKLSNPNKNFEYNNIHFKEIEELLNSPLYLKPFYKEKTQSYFNLIHK
jgi:hypothetical protein